MSIEKILVIDDEIIVRNFITETLQRKGFEVTAAENGQKAINFIKEQTFDLIFTDMKMPDLTGIDILRKVKEISPQTIVVIITAYGSIENAVEATKLGAFHYLIKPFSPDAIEALIESAAKHHAIVEENRYLRQQLSSSKDSKVIAESPAMKAIIKEAISVANSNASVFIHGESGSGKEVIAQLIHTHSPRVSQPFIKVNCAAIPETLIESEFFGHEKGAFTGATARRPGRFELANHGTLLLDEITETPAALQAKLLRVTQEHEFERIGSSKPIKVDVRLISTSNRNMKEAIAQKILREDLYYRLDVVPLYLPPLRERQEDIIPLANYFIEKVAKENHRKSKTLSEAAQKKLCSYNWPGNVRELSNIIERAMVINDGPIVTPEHLYIDGHAPLVSSSATPLPSGMSLQELEKRMIIETLQAQNNDKTKAAALLGISVRSLSTKLAKAQKTGY